MITQPEHLAWAQRIMAEKSSYYKYIYLGNPENLILIKPHIQKKEMSSSLTKPATLPSRIRKSKFY